VATTGVWTLSISQRIEVNHLWVDSDYPGRTSIHVAIAQISDIHITSGSELKELSQILQKLQPDVLVLTGDYVKWNGDYESALKFLSSMRAKSGVYAVMGDYDYSNSRKSCLFCHEVGSGKQTKRHAARFLRDKCERLKVRGKELLLCGLEGLREGESVSREQIELVRSYSKYGMVIVLSHSPLVFDSFDKNDDVLILAGDTHGGQIPLPKRLWHVLGYEKNAKYEQGWFQDGKKRMYVNRGIGTSHLPIRLFRRPEITVFHFGHAAEGSLSL
jgi:uncharacterized protein